MKNVTVLKRFPYQGRHCEPNEKTKIPEKMAVLLSKIGKVRIEAESEGDNAKPKDENPKGRGRPKKSGKVNV